MFTTVLIVFRESLEAALLVGVVAAATRGLAGRGGWLAVGIAAGVAGAVLLATMAGRLSSWFEGLGQDAVNIGVLALALSIRRRGRAARRQRAGDEQSRLRAFSQHRERHDGQ